MDERYFEDDATMRLVDRERTALGIETPAPRWRNSAVSELGFGYHEEPQPERAGAMLVTYVTAHPSAGLIPGAIVTIAIAVVNDGVESARAVRVAMSLPEGARYVGGSFKRDGRADADTEAEALLGDGLELGVLAAGQRVSLIVVLGVEPGLAPLHVAANVTAAGGAVVAARTLRLTRSAAPSAFAQALPVAADERPFYELDAEEELVYEAADAALGSAAPAVPPPVVPPPVVRPAPPPIAEDVPAKPEPPAKAPSKRRAPKRAEAVASTPPPTKNPTPTPSPKRKAPARTKAIPSPEAAPTAAPAAETPPHPVAEAPAPTAARPPQTFAVDVHGGALFSVALPQDRVAFLRRLFTGAKPPGMIAHYILLNALAAAEPLPRSDDASLAEFAALQEQRLSRALITKRLGRPLLAEDVAAPLPAQFPPRLVLAESVELPVASDGAALLLYRVMRPNELSFLSASVNNANAAPFMRASQLFVGVCAHNAVVAGEARRAEIANALRTYSTAAASEVNRLFVRARLARQTDLFGPAPNELDRQAAQLTTLLDLGA
jgi:hypothetical protein